MILSTDMHTETNCNIQGNTFSIKASPIAFDILSSKLYSNPTLAVVRELLTNAYDSQLAAGNPDKEIDVVFPTTLENEFSIRDYGTGLSKEDVMTLYTTFFGSTKSDTNDFTGGFGLGSKTPFAYTSSFTVTSFFNGIKYVFLATKKDGYPSILPISEEPTVEPNGLLIRIPVNKDIPNKFYDEAINYLSLIPEIKINSNLSRTPNVPFIKEDNVALYVPTRVSRTHSWQKDAGVFIKQGQNTYRVTFEIDSRVHRRMHEFCREMDIVYEVPIGTLNITPSRERLGADETTDTKLKQLLLELEEKVTKILKKLTTEAHLLEDNTEIPYCISKAYQSHVYDKYFSFDYSHISQYYFKWSKTECHFKFNSYEYKVMNRISTDRNYFIYNTDPYIFVYVKNFKDRNLSRKLHNILNNYDEFNSTKIVLFSIEDSSYYHKKSVLQTIRDLKGVSWTLSNAEELNYDLTVMSITEFLRKYPNSKTKKRTTLPKSTTAKPRQVNFGWVDVLTPAQSNIYAKEAKDIASFLQNSYNLIVTVNTAEDNVQSMYNRVYNFFKKGLAQLKNTDGNEFVLEYLLDKLGLTSKPTSLNVVITAKGNVKKFPDMPIISLAELNELITNSTFKCMLPYTGNWSRYINRFEVIKKHFSEIEQRFLEKTNAYKRHMMLNKYVLLNCPNYDSRYNLISYDTYRYLIDICNLEHHDIMRTDTDALVNSIVNEKLAAMYRYVYQRTDYSVYRAHKYELKLKNKFKTDLFKFLREGGNNVLL